MIRPYEARDYEDVKYLNDISYLSPCTENVLREKLAVKCWVWEDSPLVIGCIIIVPQEATNLIWSITVAPAWRRKGVATKLLLEAEKHVRPLQLHTEPFGAGQKLYTKLGYTASKIEYDWYGPGSDAVLMRKE